MIPLGFPFGEVVERSETDEVETVNLHPELPRIETQKKVYTDNIIIFIFRFYHIAIKMLEDII